MSHYNIYGENQTFPLKYSGMLNGGIKDYHISHTKKALDNDE